MTQDPSQQMTIGQLGHHVGLHVSVNLEGKTVGGVLFDSEHWVPGVVVGLSALGDYLTVELDEPIGGTEGRRLLHSGSHGQGMVSIDDPAKVKPMTLAEAQPSGIPEEIIQLVRAGKMVDAIRQYRALNGATLDEARAALAKL
jgi:hypothetical protein